LFGLQLVPLGTEGVDVIERALQQKLGGRGGGAGPLELQDLPAVARDLNAIALDFARMKSMSGMSAS
jgi:hypothetical protein